MLDSNLFQLDINSLAEWSCVWKMAFSESKFIHLNFSYNPRIIPTPYTINHTSLNTKDSHRDLHGVILSLTSKWNEQYNNMSLNMLLYCLNMLLYHIFGSDEGLQAETSAINCTKIITCRSIGENNCGKCATRIK